MSKSVNIEVDRHTADVLQRRAAELGITVPQLVAELAALDAGPRDADAAEIAELDHRVARAAEHKAVSHDQVVRWLRTWGTNQFRPRQGK